MSTLVYIIVPTFNSLQVYTTAEIVIGEAVTLQYEYELDPTYGYHELAVVPRKE